jgi:hypothetical protein
MATETMSMKKAAEKVLAETGGPLHSEEITKRALDEQLVKTKGKTPGATMAAQLAVDVKRKDSPFIRTRPGVYGLRGRDRKGQKPKAAQEAR